LGIAKKLSRWLRPSTAARRPPADAVTSIGSYLEGDRGDSVVLPLLPASGANTANIEFAAASIVERVLLGALVRRERPVRIFEIGTFRGVTALSLATNCGWDAVLYTLDLPPELSARAVDETFYRGTASSGFRRLAEAGAERDVGAALRGYSGPCRVEQLFGDAATFDFGPYSAAIDLFFVDGCHEYEGARRDTSIALRCLRPGGLVLWHDYTREGVQRAVRDAWRVSPITWIESTTLALARKPEGV
jgi:predicted O-methyltransferase YrrM